MELIYIIGIAQGLVLLLMVAAYLGAVRWKDIGLVDLGWTLGVGMAGCVYAILLADFHPERRLLVALLAGTWAGRLSWHVLTHRIAGKAEDARYRRLREYWGDRARVYIPALFLAEAPLAIVFSLPLLLAMTNPSPTLTGWDVAGIAVWILSVAGETVADRQLEQFRRQPANRGRTCRDGLWRYSRHPNYFFEWLHWWAYVLLAVGAPHGWIALVGPALMLAFLFGLTGIPHAERQALAHRGDDYRRYQQTTSVFIPWFKRKESH
jgi:steroid 5-alpha reductase family enzyme